MIENLEQAERGLLRERAAQARWHFRRAVRPIYAATSEDPDDPVQHIGSCILLSIDGRRILSTAAHVLDTQGPRASLFVGGRVGTHLVPIMGGMVKATTAPHDDRDRDIFDSGFWELPRDTVAALGDVQFLDESRFSHNRAPTEYRYYTAMGYRVRRNEDAVDHRRKAIETRASSYSAGLVEVPRPSAKLGFSTAQHLFLRFTKHAEYEDGEHANTFDPQGFSGGALIDLGNFMPGEVYATKNTWCPRLSGMLIEHQKEHKALVAVRIDSIVAGIRNALRSRAA